MPVVVGNLAQVTTGEGWSFSKTSVSVAVRSVSSEYCREVQTWEPLMYFQLGELRILMWARSEPTWSREQAHARV
jgi:hypothetical protein